MDTDVVIVGAGPAGLFAAFEVGFLGYTSVVVDAQPQVGGQLAALYPDKPIYDVPACAGMAAGELVHKLKAQADMYAPTYLLERHAQTLRGEAGAFELETAEGDVVGCKVVIIAGGSGMFLPRKPAGLADLDVWEKAGAVRYAVTDKAAMAGKNVILAGGGDSAVDWVLALADVAKHVTVVHRRPEFRAAEASVAAMRAREAEGKVSVVTPFELGELRGEGGVLREVALKTMEGESKVISADMVVCCFGLLPNPGPVADWGLGMEKGLIPVDRQTQETARKGVLCVGDMAHHDGKVSLIVTGFGEGCVAAKTVQGIIHPEKKWRVQYSTSKGLPGA